MKLIKQSDGSTGVIAYFDSGDLADRTEVFEHFRAHLFRNALRLTGNQSDADEVMQIACEQLLETPQEKLEQVNNIEAWLFVLVSNCAKRYIRTEVRLRDRHQRAAEHTDRIVKDRQAAKEERAEGEELIAEVRGALNDLPEMYQQPIYLFYIEGLAWKEVASSMGLKEEAVRKRAQRGIGKIRKMMLRSGQSVSMLVLCSLFNSLRASGVVGEAVWLKASAAGLASSTTKASAIKVVAGSAWFQTIAACLLVSSAFALSFTSNVDQEQYSFNENNPLSSEGAVYYFDEVEDIKRTRRDDNSTQRVTAWRRLSPKDFHAYNGVSMKQNPDESYTYVIDSKSAILSDISLLYPKLDFTDPAGHRLRFHYQITEVYKDQAQKRHLGDLDRARFGFAVNYGGVQSDGLSYQRGTSNTNLGMLLPESGSMAGNIEVEILPVKNGRYLRLKKFRVLSNGKRISGGEISVPAPGQSGFAFYYALAFVSGVRMEIFDIQVSEIFPERSQKPRFTHE